MSKKIVMLLFLMLVLISVSAVSAADMDDNADTIVSSADAETIAVSNDVDAIDDLSENDAGGDDKALANDAKSVAAGKNSDDGAYENSTSQLLATSDENNVLENENGGEILKETSSTWYVDANAASGGDGSIVKPFKTLKEAINKVQDYDVIKIAPGTYEGGNNIELTVNKIVSLERYGDGEAIFDADKDSRVLKITAQTVNITGLTFKNGKCDGNGGAVYFEHSGTVTNCTFIKNQATDGHKGGAVYFGESGIALNSIFTDNSADDDGGAIFEGGAINCTFTGNSANDHGGAIHHGDGNYTAVNCTFNNNAAGSGGATYGVDVVNCNFNGNKAKEGVGGAVYFGGLGTVTNCNFTDNQAPLKDKDDSGGAIYFNENGGNVTGSNFIRNKAFRGGAIHFESCEGNVSDCNFVNNTADVYMSTGGVISFDRGVIERCNFTGGIANFGGAIHCYGFPTTIRYCNFYENEGCSVQSTGGAIYFANDNGGSVSNCNFSKNFADHGGAIYVKYYANIIDCNFDENRASSGGAIICYNGFDACKIKNCYFIKNLAYVRGGAINLDYLCDFIYLSQCVFIGNSAQNWGGAICTFEYSRIDAAHCDFINNTANNGGALYSSGGTLNYCNFTGNKASEGSAIYYDVYQDGSISNSVFLDNRAGADYFDIVKKNNNVEITFVGNDNIINAIISIGKDVKFNNVTYWGENGIMNTGRVTMGRSDREPGQNITVNMVVNDIVVIDKTYVTDRNGKIVLDLVPGNITITATHEADSYYTRATKTQTFEIGAFELLQEAINRASENSVMNLTRNYTYNVYDSITSGVLIDKNITVNGNGFTIDARGKSRIFNVTSGSVNLINITLKNGRADDGGAIYFSESGTVTNCTFINNQATDDHNGGAVYFGLRATGTVTNCNFTNNTARYGGAVHFFNDGTVVNCNFTNNTARYGGAVHFFNDGTVANCNFTNNNASDGGAVHFDGDGEVTNCTFINNTASKNGGAIYFTSTDSPKGSVTNCNFTNNTADSYGGAIYMGAYGNITNCNFTDNKAGDEGGAVYFYYYYYQTYNVINCNFKDNTATTGGAINFDGVATVTNCNFVGNNATGNGGAVNVGSNDCTFEYCNFTGNKAASGSAIYFYSSYATKTVSNSCFLDNRANAKDLNVTKEDNNITIIFTGQNNILNAIYSRNGAEVTFTNVTYWDVNGITNTGSSSIKLSGSDNEAGQNITVRMVVNDITLIDKTYVTDENGKIVLDLVAGNATITATHEEDSYYNYLTKTQTFEVPGIETSLELSYSNYIIEASITPENVKGNVTFTIEDDQGIVRTVESSLINSVAKLDLSDWVAGEYKIEALYKGNITYYPSKSNMTVTVTLRNASVAAEDMELKVGENGTVGYTTIPASLNVTFVADNSGVVSVSNNGTVTALKNGTARITINVGDDKKYAKNSTVITVTVSLNDASVSVNNSTVDLFVDGNFTIVATTSPASLDVTYVIDNSGIVRVDDSGVVTALKEGTASIIVKVGGDGVYAENSTVVTVTVSKVPTLIEVNSTVGELSAGAMGHVVAELNPSDAGNLTYVSNDTSVATVSSTGVIVANKAGVALITVSFNGTDKYAAAENKTIVLTVNLNDAGVSVNNSTLDLLVDDTFDLNASTVPKGLNVTYVIDNSGVVEVSSDGVVTALKEGTASIIVKVGGDGVYAENSTVVTVTVSKVPTLIEINSTVGELSAGAMGHVSAKLNPSDAGNLTYVSNDTSVAMVSSTGVIKANKAGTALITVSFNGTDKYAAAENKTIVLTVNLKDTSVSVNNSTVVLFVGGNFTIVPTTSPKGLNVTYIQDNSGVVAVDENGTVTALKNGTASIIVKVGGDGVYAENTTIVTVTVFALMHTEINVANATVALKINENVTAGATLTPAEAGNLTYTSSNSSVAIVENGTIKAVGTGNATITVSFAGNDKYSAAENKTINVTVSLNDVIINVKNSTVELVFGDSFTINATTVPEGLSLIYVPDESGIVSVDENGTVTTLKPGIAKILVKFNGNDVYAANSTVVTVKVGADKVIIPPEEAFNFTSSKVIAVNLPETATGFVLLDINGTQAHVPLVNGKANLTIPKLAEGTYNATVTYAGDEFYAPISVTKEINVTSNVPESALSIPDTSKSDDPTTYSISLPGDAGGFLEVDVDGKQYVAPLINGSASVTVPALSAGSHRVTVKYTGDKNYSPVTKETTLNVTDPVFKLSENKNVAVIYSGKATYKVLVTMDGKAVGAGEIVTVKYNGNTYTVRTGKDGYAALNLDTQVKVKTYDITAEYKGIKVTNKVTINHIIKAGNKKVKKSKKVTKVKVSLKKVDGKYLKGKKLKIKFKGKTYKVKTNKKGVATWKVKKSMLKKLKVGKKYKYKVTYGKDIVTKKLTIKK